MYVTARTVASFQGNLKAQQARQINLEKYYSLFLPVMSSELIPSAINKQVFFFPLFQGGHGCLKSQFLPKTMQHTYHLYWSLTLSLWLERNSHTRHQTHHTKLRSFTPSFEPCLPNFIMTSVLVSILIQNWRHFEL